MPYKPTQFGLLIHEDPKRAHAKLAKLFERCGGSRRKVAQRLGVDESTLCRWLQKLARAGLKDPRGKRKPRQPAQPRKAAAPARSRRESARSPAA